jgi:hypothetical protein
VAQVVEPHAIEAEVSDHCPPRGQLPEVAAPDRPVRPVSTNAAGSSSTWAAAMWLRIAAVTDGGIEPCVVSRIIARYRAGTASASATTSAADNTGRSVGCSVSASRTLQRFRGMLALASRLVD